MPRRRKYELGVIQQSLKSLDFHIDPVMIPVRDKGVDQVRFFPEKTQSLMKVAKPQ